MEGSTEQQQFHEPSPSARRSRETLRGARRDQDSESRRDVPPGLSLPVRRGTTLIMKRSTFTASPLCCRRGVFFS